MALRIDGLYNPQSEGNFLDEKHPICTLKQLSEIWSWSCSFPVSPKRQCAVPVLYSSGEGGGCVEFSLAFSVAAVLLV